MRTSGSQMFRKLSPSTPAIPARATRTRVLVQAITKTHDLSNENATVHRPIQAPTGLLQSNKMWEALHFLTKHAWGASCSCLGQAFSLVCVDLIGSSFTADFSTVCSIQHNSHRQPASKGLEGDICTHIAHSQTEGLPAFQASSAMLLSKQLFDQVKVTHHPDTWVACCWCNLQCCPQMLKLGFYSQLSHFFILSHTLTFCWHDWRVSASAIQIRCDCSQQRRRCMYSLASR